MRTSTLITALVGANAAAAKLVKIMTTSTQENDYAWDVTNWNAGCAKGGCSYDFNITGIQNMTASPKTPAFEAYCSSTSGEMAPYELCKRVDTNDNDARIAAKLLRSNTTANGNTLAHIQVSLQWTDLSMDGMWWNYTGSAYSTYNQFVPDMSSLNFTVDPDELRGVA